HSAETLLPAVACQKIYDGVSAALRRRDAWHTYVLTKPVTLDLTFKNYLPAEVLSYLRSVQRTDSHSIRFVGQDMREVSDFVDFVDTYSPELAP
ncbi:MAG: M55 family metallopeptidase, partial [Proteobacteria bacterium]|nr:M55 family metallopeptidase [Pseudomonadota bacterium]